MSEDKGGKTKITIKKSDPKSEKAEKKMAKLAKKAVKPTKEAKKKAAKPNYEELPPTKNPFKKIHRYFKASFAELRQVRWPNRAAAWKMTLSVFVYCALMMAFILLLDMLFTFIFDLLLK